MFDHGGVRRHLGYKFLLIINDLRPKKLPVAKKWHSVRRKPSQNVWFSHRPQTDNTPHRRKNPILPKQGLVRRATNKYRLAKEIGVRAGRISDIEAGRRAITTDNDLRP
jgi:hypothetical protein